MSLVYAASRDAKSSTAARRFTNIDEVYAMERVDAETLRAARFAIFLGSPRYLQPLQELLTSLQAKANRGVRLSRETSKLLVSLTKHLRVKH